jgi:hypothetical protein
MRRILYFLRELAWTSIIAVAVGVSALAVAIFSGSMIDVILALGANAILYSILALRS